MVHTPRRRALLTASAGAALAALPPSIRAALTVPANQRTGTIKDVEHVVILMQENRSFDHYFGAFPGARGFGDRFTIPLPDGRSVWEQQGADRVVLPYHLDARLGNAQCVIGTPHEWPDAQAAWDCGRMASWPKAKTPTSMGYFLESEIPFQYALASAFTLCDAYHSSMHAGTNPNRLFLWTGTNGPTGSGVASVVNEWDGPGRADQGYVWKTYPERLQEAGVRWKVYQYLPDNFGNNSLAGFRPFRDASIRAGNPAEPAKDFTAFVPHSDALEARLPLYKGNGNTLPARSGADLESMFEGLRRDCQSGKLPQVSWVIAPRMYSEHPQGSSPVQGGWFTQKVLEILTENTELWSKTVFLVNYDENDGYFDHMPSPSAPSMRADGSFAGKSTVPFDSELFRHPPPAGSSLQPPSDGGVYGPGMRVPMLVVSPWSRGGWVNSQVFDHTSVLQFLEKRFGVAEPNISAWRRAVCGDLTSAFNFVNPDRDTPPTLATFNRTVADTTRVRQEALPQVPLPAESSQSLPRQAAGVRPSRALPYRLETVARTDAASRRFKLDIINRGSQGAVLHVYDRLRLDQIPRRFMVGAGQRLADDWTAEGAYDLWLLGPNGFHRAWRGQPGQAEPGIGIESSGHSLLITLDNSGAEPVTLTIARCPYTGTAAQTLTLQPGARHLHRVGTSGSGGWYDQTFESGAGWMRRLAGRLETGADSVTDPLMGA